MGRNSAPRPLGVGRPDHAVVFPVKPIRPSHQLAEEVLFVLGRDQLKLELPLLPIVDSEPVERPSE